MRNRKLVYNTALLTCSSLLMSAMSMAFQAWLVRKIGAAGIGLYQLISSVTVLLATFAVSGIRYASTRLVSEEIGADSPERIAAAMRRCTAYALLFGCTAMAVLWLIAEPVGFLCIGDARAVRPLRLCAFCMPCMAFNSAFSGYFTACGRVWKSTLVHVTEAVLEICFVVMRLSHAQPGNIEQSCAAIAQGKLTADICSFVMMTAFYISDRAAHFSGGGEGGQLTGRMLRIALPLAVSAYVRSALNTVQHILVPRSLRMSGLSADASLSGYGTVHGMALPVVLFPACVMYSAAELIVPELTDAQMQKKAARIRSTVGALMRTGVIYSLAVAAFIFIFADKISAVVYETGAAAKYIRILAPLIPIMYCDILTDGCLKGLGEQAWTMGVNIFDSLSGLLLVIWLMPRYALTAYLGMIWFTEAVNFALSIGRLVYILRRRYSAV